MVNYDRIVPITRIDYLTLIATVMFMNQTQFDLLAADDVEGNFTVSVPGSYLANQPVKSLNFTDDGSVILCAAYDFDGIKVNGVLAETDPIKADGVTLYNAVCRSGTVTVSQITPELA